MNRDNQGQNRHPAGAPRSIGGQYAPDNARGGAASGSILTPRPPRAEATIRWQQYDGRGNVTYESDVEYLDIHRVLDEMPLSALIDDDGDPVEDFVHDEPGDNLYYRAEELGLVQGSPVGENASFSFSLDPEDMYEYIDYRRKYELVDGGDPMAIAAADAETSDVQIRQAEDEMKALQAKMQAARVRRVRALSKLAGADIERISIDDEGYDMSYTVYDSTGEVVEIDPLNDRGLLLEIEELVYGRRPNVAHIAIKEGE